MSNGFFYGTPRGALLEVIPGAPGGVVPPPTAPLQYPRSNAAGSAWAVGNTGVVDFVVDCGADRTGVVDCANAWDVAFAKLSALAVDPKLVALSARLFIPPGKYTLRSNPVVSTWNFSNLATTLYIEGAGQDISIFQFAGFDLPEFANMYTLVVRDLTFAGTTPSYLVPDCTNGIGTNVHNDILFERVKFYNIAATQSILTLTAAQSTVMRDCQVTACGATTNAKAMIVANSPQLARFQNVLWLDIGLMNGFSAVGKDAANFKHVEVLGGASLNVGLVEFVDCFFDESTTAAVTVTGSAAFPVPRARFENCYWNPPTSSGPLIDATYCELVEVSGAIDSGFHVTSTSPIVNATNTTNVRLSKVRANGISNSVVVDNQCRLVSVADSPQVVVVAANLIATRIERTESGQRQLPRPLATVAALGSVLKLAAVPGAPGYALLGAADLPTLAAAAATAVGAVGDTANAAAPSQQVTLLSDGTTAIAVGDPVTNVGALADGQVKQAAAATASVVGIAMTPAAVGVPVVFQAWLQPT